MSARACEMTVGYDEPAAPHRCGRVAVRRFRLDDGRWGYLCLAHARMAADCGDTFGPGEACFDGEDDGPLGGPGDSLGTPTTDSGE